MTNKLCEDDKNSLQQELETREQRLQQELSIRRCMEHRMHRILDDTKLQWKKECVSQTCKISFYSRLTSRRAQHEACLCAGPPR